MATFPFEPSGEGTIALQTHTFRDAKGFTAVCKYYITANGASEDNLAVYIQSIITALKAVSNAAYQGSQGPVSEYGVKQYGSAANAYASCRQKARLAFQDASGGLHHFAIPAPKLAVFDADRQTVLPSGVSALTALLAQNTITPGNAAPFVCARSGIFWSNYMGGFFVAGQRAANKTFILSGALTGGEPGD